MRCRVASNAVVIGLLALSTPVFAQSHEYRAKVDYLLLFLRYVTWPPSVYPIADSTLVIGVLGDDPFGALLDSAISRAERRGMKFQVRRAQRAAEAEGFHVVFIPRGDPELNGGWLDTLRNRPILTVVETEREFESGAIIHLDMVDGRVRFDVNLPILRNSGLRILSPMLESARRIVGNGGSG